MTDGRPAGVNLPDRPEGRTHLSAAECRKLTVTVVNDSLPGVEKIEFWNLNLIEFDVIWSLVR
jgi:hypothetical protein